MALDEQTAWMAKTNNLVYEEIASIRVWQQLHDFELVWLVDAVTCVITALHASCREHRCSCSRTIYPSWLGMGLTMILTPLRHEGDCYICFKTDLRTINIGIWPYQDITRFLGRDQCPGDAARYLKDWHDALHDWLKNHVTFKKIAD
jgi:hypothetical protein